MPSTPYIRVRICRAIMTVGRYCALTATALLATAITANARCNGADILSELVKDHPSVMKSVRARADAVANTQAVFWKVHKKGLTPSYLFGTMHVSEPRIHDLPEGVEKALLASRRLALELADMSPAATMGAIAGSPRLMVYTDGSRLDQKLTADEFAEVTAVLGRAGMPAQTVAVLRPWIVGVMMSMPVCEQNAIRSGKLALDQVIGNLARMNNIPVIGLETAKLQFETFAGIPDEDQIAMLRTALAFADRREDMYETLIQAYLRRDLGIVLSLTQGLAKIAGLDHSGTASFNEALIYKRNQTMFESSKPLVAGGGAFIAVGAAHLIGDNGLVALYRKAGFNVTPGK